MENSIQQYMLWLDAMHPELYAEVYRRMNSGLGATEAEPSVWDKFVKTVSDLAPVYIATEQQKKINEINLARAQAGQPPLDAADASTVSAQVGLSRSTQNTILLSAAVLGGALVLPRLMGGRNRGR